MASNADRTIVLDCDNLPVREINRAIRKAAADGASEIRLQHPAARHNLGVGLGEGVRLIIEGPAGYYVGGLNDGATVEVRGGAGWGAAESMRDGTVVIDGDAGNAVAASIRAGTVVVRGNASTRAGIAMKGGTLLIGGNAGPMAGFMMQKGSLMICGDAGDGVADSMYDGTVYVGGRVGELGADAVEAELSEEEREFLRSQLDRWGLPVPASFRKLVAGRVLWNFRKADLELWKTAL